MKRAKYLDSSASGIVRFKKFLLKKKPRIKISEIALKINKGLTVTKERIKNLRDRNIIKREGSLRGGYWEVLNKL